MAVRTKVQGPRKLPQKWPNEELWGVMGHNGQYPFYTAVIVSDGVVRSTPPLANWMLGRLWLECAQMCLDRGWQVWHVDTEKQRLLDQEKARHARGSVQMGMDLGDDRSVKREASVPARPPLAQQRRAAH
jgi:hypothetical protein